MKEITNTLPLWTSYTNLRHSLDDHPSLGYSRNFVCGRVMDLFWKDLMIQPPLGQLKIY